ncbi:MAG: DUF4363 family protein [Bacillota bacterium]|nr:DUF4363 family protein [Bacillota bacterium]
MKKIYLALVFLIGIPVVTVIYVSYISNKCVNFAQVIDRVYEDADSRYVKEDYKDLEKKWDKLEKILSISINHDEIDSINESITKGKEYLENNNIDYFKCELKWMKKMIYHVKELEMPTIENIF